MRRTRRPPTISPECPECGDQYCKVTRSGADLNGRIVRERRCKNCEQRFVTVEVVVPNTTFGRLDVELSTYQKLWRRQKRGWHAQPGHEQKITDRLDITLKVRKPNEEDVSIVAA